jgi:hypothetical protein
MRACLSGRKQVEVDGLPTDILEMKQKTTQSKINQRVGGQSEAYESVR